METDEALYALARQGDANAFDRLYSQYEHRLFGFILRLLGERAEAEEVFHDTFLKVLESPTAQFALLRLGATEPASKASRFATWSTPFAARRAAKSL